MHFKLWDLFVIYPMHTSRDFVHIDNQIRTGLSSEKILMSFIEDKHNKHKILWIR